MQGESHPAYLPKAPANAGLSVVQVSEIEKNSVKIRAKSLTSDKKRIIITETEDRGAFRHQYPEADPYGASGERDRRRSLKAPLRIGDFRLGGQRRSVRLSQSFCGELSLIIFLTAEAFHQHSCFAKRLGSPHDVRAFFVFRDRSSTGGQQDSGFGMQRAAHRPHRRKKA